jgi:ketosteroid isomerase-like protein
VSGRQDHDQVSDNVAVVLETFSAVERRDGGALLALCDPAVQFIWPSSLSYGGKGLEGLAESGAAFRAAWDDFQPEAERQMDPCVVAAAGDEVVVCWQQKGVDRAGRRLQTPVLGRYRVRNGKLARAHMFYFDTVEVVSFLADAQRPAPAATS